MNFKTISKILVAILGFLGIIFLVRIVAAGDEAIKTGGEDGLVEPMAYVAYFIFALTIVFVLFFVLKNLITNAICFMKNCQPSLLDVILTNAKKSCI